jgi:hypothetical protein
VLSSARIAGVALDEFCQQLALPYEENALGKIASETRTSGVESQRGHPNHGISAALVRIERANLRDEDAASTVSSLVPESVQSGESVSVPSRHCQSERGRSRSVEPTQLQRTKIPGIVSRDPEAIHRRVGDGGYSRLDGEKVTHETRYQVRTVEVLGANQYADFSRAKRYSSAHRLEGEFKCVLLQT